jgi:TusA-related sulfurtransferase
MAGLLTVDVRDMQCAQALAQAAQAMQRLTRGETVELTCNAEDVRRDLVAWAQQVRHQVVGEDAHDGDTRLTIRKHQSPEMNL